MSNKEIPGHSSSPESSPKAPVKKSDKLNQPNSGEQMQQANQKESMNIAKENCIAFNNLLATLDPPLTMSFDGIDTYEVITPGGFSVFSKLSFPKQLLAAPGEKLEVILATELLKQIDKPGAKPGQQKIIDALKGLMDKND